MDPETQEVIVIKDNGKQYKSNGIHRTDYLCNNNVVYDLDVLQSIPNSEISTETRRLKEERRRRREEKRKAKKRRRLSQAQVEVHKQINAIFDPDLLGEQKGKGCIYYIYISY